MAHFVRVRAPGMWLTGTVLDGGELESFDAQIFAAINGDAGGTWAPTNPIVIGGDGIEITGAFVVSGATTAQFTVAAVNFEGNVAFVGAPSAIDFGPQTVVAVATGSDWEFDGDIEFNGQIIINAGIDEIDGIVYCAPGFEMQCDGDIFMFAGSLLRVDSGATLTCAAGSTCTLAGTNTISGATTQSGKLTKSGSGGRTQKRVSTLTPNANNTADVSADIFLFTHSNTSLYTLTMRRTTAPTPTAGEEIQLLLDMSDPSGSLNIVNETSGTVIVSVGGHATQGKFRFTFVYDGSAWRLASCYDKPGNVTLGASA